jgi:hypothetical protein
MHTKIRHILYSLVFSVVIMALWGIILTSAAQEGPEPTGTPDNNFVNEFLDPIYLPIVNRVSCIPETVESPFSMQIAALHQITTTASILGPTHTMSPTMSKAEYDAWYDQAFSSLMSYLSDSGAGYARVFIAWSDIEPNEPEPGQPPVYDQNWLQWYDARLAQIAQDGIKIIVTMGFVPSWAGDGDGASCPAIFPDQIAHYQQFLTFLVTRYSQPPYNVKHWEIFNEADNTNPGYSYACFGLNGAAYKDILAASRSVIKGIVPDATILMSGLAYDFFIEYGPPGGPFNRYFADDVMAAGGASYFDALNFHYFPDFHAEWDEQWNPPNPPPTCGPIRDGLDWTYDYSGIDVIAKKNHFTNRMKTCFGVNKPVWLTEVGAHGELGLPDPDPHSLSNQARYVIKGHTRALAAGVQNITWYALATPNDPYEQSLLFNDSLTPKPAYYTYQTMTSELKDFRYNRTLNLPGGEAYVFQKKCVGEKTVAWGNNVPITFSPASSLRVVNFLGYESTVTDGGSGDIDLTHNGSVQLLITADPVFINVISY